MSDAPGDPAPGSRKRMIVIGGVSVALAGVIVAGVIAAGNRDGAQIDLGGEAEAVATATAPAPATTAPSAGTARPPATAPVITGQGDPVRISGTDPVTGRAVRLADFTGKPTIVAIWASWCPGCNEEAPHLARVAATRDDVNIVGINYRDGRSAARDFTSRYGWSFPSIEDAGGEISFGLGLQGTPTTIFLDAEHREIGRVVGAAGEAELSEAVDRITATRPAAQ